MTPVRHAVRGAPNEALTRSEKSTERVKTLVTKLQSKSGGTSVTERFTALNYIVKLDSQK